MPTGKSQLRPLQAADLTSVASELGQPVADKLLPLVNACVAVIQDAQAKRPTTTEGRRAILKSIRKLSNRLDDLADALGRVSKGASASITRLFAEPVTRLFDAEAFAELVEVDLTAHMGERYFQRLADERGGPLAVILTDLRQRKGQVADHLAIGLLGGVVDQLNTPLRAALAQAAARASKGGAPPRWERNFLIQELARAYQRITGKRPISTPTGPFVLMCHHVLESTGLGADGVEKAVQQVLKRMGVTRARKHATGGGPRG